jgi:signal transduction histidine kinase
VGNAVFRRSNTVAEMTSTSLIALVLVATGLSIIASDPEARTWSRVALLAEQLVLPAALASAVVLAITTRIRPTTSSAWLAAAMTLAGIQGLPMFAATGDSALSGQSGLSAAIVVGLTSLLVLRVADSRWIHIAPMPLAIAIGLLLVVVRGTWRQLPLPTVEPGHAVAAGCALLISISVVLLGVSLWRRSALPLGRTRLTLAVFLWAGAATITEVGLSDGPAGSLAAAAGALAASTLITATALDLLWHAMRQEQADIHHLQQQLVTMRDEAREGVEQMHEVKGTIAGIVSATNLIRNEDRLSHQHRERLEEMLASETARLQRLVHSDTDVSHAIVDLDDVIGPVVMAHRVQGQSVLWTPPSISVVAHADELAEVINIMLQNAATHAHGAPVRIFTREREGDLQLVVADSGPGVPLELRDQIFDWGCHQAGSAGQGVGLATAHRLLARRGCYLRLDPDHDPHGAAFVIELKRAAQSGRGADTVLMS